MSRRDEQYADIRAGELAALSAKPSDTNANYSYKVLEKRVEDVVAEVHSRLGLEKYVGNELGPAAQQVRSTVEIVLGRGQVPVSDAVFRLGRLQDDGEGGMVGVESDGMMLST